MNKKSGGLLVFRFRDRVIEIFLVHPGGPFFKNKDLGAWSIPKGEFDENENAFDAAVREFEEETGIKLKGKFIELSPVTQKSGKTVFAWAIESDIDCSLIKCNTFKLEWPPKSGKIREFPEIDKGEWFKVDQARLKINQSQFAFIEELLKKLNIS